KEMATLEKAYRSAEEVWRTIVSWQANKDEQGELVTLYAIRTLFVFAQLYVAMCLMDQAIVASKTLAGLADDHFDLDFYKGKVASARYYVNNSLPNIFTVSEVIKNADTTVLEVPEEVLIVS
ncbi:MAG TPA: acyl-CoA dehydrogenase C-terminal domain-containing protein, partial [Desulfosporosinus sp.]|nr:acyl-CoA dehydrogenase C-terminal domain-containing protein [Desulfosporosinus sp.]